MTPSDFITERRTMEQVTLIIPAEHRAAVMDAMFADGWRTYGRSGPYTDEQMWPKCDPTRFMITMQRELEAPCPPT